MKTLEELIAERDAMLKANPNLQPLQDEIDSLMDLALTPKERLDIIGTMMQGKLLELADALTNIKIILERKVE